MGLQHLDCWNHGFAFPLRTWAFFSFCFQIRRYKLSALVKRSNSCFVLTDRRSDFIGRLEGCELNCECVKFYLECTAALLQDQAKDFDLGRLAYLLNLVPWTWHIAAEAWSWRSASSSVTLRCAAPSAASRRPRSSSHPATWHRIKRRRSGGSFGGVAGSRILPMLWNQTWQLSLLSNLILNERTGEA